MAAPCSPRAAILGPSLLAPSLLAAIEHVAIADDCRSASVGARHIEASTTAELMHRLSHAIYEVLHVGWSTQPPDVVKASKDEDFEARLFAATPHASVLRTASVLAADAGQVFVELDGVKVVIPHPGASESCQPGSRPQPGSRLPVRLPSCRPALSPGYWVADGTRALAATDRIIRLYVHLTTPAAAVAAWGTVLAMLEELGIAFRAKVTSVPALLPRRDALVVYTGEGDLPAVLAVAHRVASMTQVGPEVSVFSERIEPGVAIAWEPTDSRPAMRGLSFGEHRARATAEGLVQHAGSSDGSTVAEAVRHALAAARIDPARPARNLP